MPEALTDASPVQVARTEAADDAPLLPRSLLKQRWGDHFRLVRQAKGISQERLAARAGVAMSAVANWEQGRNLPKQDSLQAMKALLPQLKTPEKIEAQLVAELASAAQQPAGKPADQEMLESAVARLAQLETDVERLRRQNEALRTEGVQMRALIAAEDLISGEDPPSQEALEGHGSDAGEPSQLAAVEPVRLAARGSWRTSLGGWVALGRLRSLVSMMTSLAAFFMLSLMFSAFSAGAGGGFCSSDQSSSTPTCPEGEHWSSRFQKCKTDEAKPLPDCRKTGGVRPCCEVGEEECGPGWP